MTLDNETEDALPEGFLVATPSDAAANSYCTVEEMDQLLNGVASKIALKWDVLEIEDEARILIEGSRLIDQFRLWGPPKVQTQGLSFPRAVDAADVIPQGVRLALLEYVKYRVDGKMVGLKNLQKEGVTTQSISGQTASMKTDLSELPAGAKRELMKLAQSYWPSPRTNRSYGRFDPAAQDDGSLFG